MHSTWFDARACARLASLLIPVILLMMSPPGGSRAESTPPAGVGPSVQEVVEFTKLVPQGISPYTETQLNLAPNRLRAFVVTRKASVERGSNVYEILLLDVAPDHLALDRPAAPRSLLKFETTNDNNRSVPYLQSARWLDDDTLAFRARLAESPFQVYTLDVNTLKLTQRTFEPHGVVSFGIAADQSRLVYAIQVPNPPMAPGERSLVVENRSFFSVNFGQTNLPSQRHQYQYAVIDAGAAGPGRRLGGVVAGIAAPFMPNISVSPDGRWALIPRYEESRHLEWAAAYPLMGETAQKVGPALNIDPKGYFVRPRQWLARRNVAYRLSDATERLVVDAPDDATPADPSRVDTLWQGGGTSVIVAGTHLPPLPGTASPVSTAAHVIEYWPDSGRYADIAALDGRLEMLRPSADGKGFAVQMEGGKRLSFVRDRTGGWTRAASPESAKPDSDQEGHLASAGWKLRVEQALNQPPDVVAVGPGGRRVRLTTLNPHYAPSTWGTMRAYSWQDASGKRYSGGLMVPANYEPTRRYPMVLQTYGFDPSHFYLDGSNLVDGGWSSGYAGRAFLRQGILVLALPHLLREPDEPRSLPMRHDKAAAMARSAIDALVAAGIADPQRIGIIGWSVWGEHVQNMLTFYDLPVRAASILDGDSNSLWALIVTTGHSDYVYRRFEATNAGMPYGDGLANWVARDPSLHTDCIRAAVRIENYGPSSKIHWDTYGLLRRQQKAVEKVVFPGGAHALGHPYDRMISLQGNVDWYAFWLRGEERSQVILRSETAQSLRRQYVRWREMAELKRLDDAKARCSATPPRRG
ncbi:hypothetical protein [Piscinibacter sakaiensis]|uniref:hypothetical protein n=1 Tax=Piscinibacter sakaiensis TaxID=1547922 RepID=UPI003AAD5352